MSKKKTNSQYFWILSTIAAITVLACAAVAIYYWNNTAWGNALSQQDETLKACRKAGLPWTAAELKLAAPKGAKNAGLLIKQSQKNTGFAGDRSKLETVSTELSDFYKTRDPANLKAAVTAVSTRLAEARKIGDCGYCDFEREYDRGGWVLMPELSHVKSLVKLLVAASLVEASQDHFAAAVNDMGRALSLSGMSSTEPNLIGPLVSIACYSICFKATETLAEMMSEDSKDLAALAKALEHHKPAYSVQRSLQGEAFMGVATLRNLKNIKPITSEQDPYKWEPLQKELPKSSAALIKSGFPDNRIGRAYLVRHMQTLTKFANEARTTNDLFRLGASFDLYAASLADKDRSYACARLLLPVFANCFASIQQCYANYEVQNALIRALRFRAEKGRFPTSLSEAGYTGTDPIAGGSLKYWHSGNTCKVYSFGVDKTDQGGLRRQERKGSAEEYQGYDVVASYPAYRSNK